jgi:hypothetical protein
VLCTVAHTVVLHRSKCWGSHGSPARLFLPPDNVVGRGPKVGLERVEGVVEAERNEWDTYDGEPEEEAAKELAGHAVNLA